MWDPKTRPTSTQALSHEYFTDAFDPLRPKSSASRFLSRKQSDLSNSIKETSDTTPTLSSKTSSWFRKSLVARESAPAVPQHVPAAKPPTPVQQPQPQVAPDASKARPQAYKRATWNNGLPSNAAPIPILPSIRPMSPLTDAVTAQANATSNQSEEKASKKIGRQLSVASNGNHYADVHRNEAERRLEGHSGITSPTNGQKESFFSHLRKRARRLSGRYQTPMSPNAEDIEANAGCAPWGSNRQSMVIDQPGLLGSNAPSHAELNELDKALQNVRYSLDAAAQQSPANTKGATRVASNPVLKRHHSLPHGQESRTSENGTVGPVSSRTRRAAQKQPYPSNRYETPDEEEELLDEALASAHKAAKRLDRHAQHSGNYQSTPAAKQEASYGGAYLTPAHSANRNNVNFGQNEYTTPTQPLDINKTRPQKEDPVSKWPTPPYDENDWAASAAASIFAAGTAYR